MRRVPEPRASWGDYPLPLPWCFWTCGCGRGGRVCWVCLCQLDKAILSSPLPVGPFLLQPYTAPQRCHCGALGSGRGLSKTICMICVILFLLSGTPGCMGWGAWDVAVSLCPGSCPLSQHPSAACCYPLVPGNQLYKD